MKDAAHHLRHVQKKVIQSERKSRNKSQILNGTPATHILGQAIQNEQESQKKS